MSSPFSMYTFPDTLEGKGRVKAMLDAFRGLLAERFAGPDGAREFRNGILYAVQSLCPHPVEHWAENGGEEPFDTYICGVCGALEVEKNTN